MMGVHGDFVVGSTEKLRVNHSDAQWSLLVVITPRATHTECWEVTRMVSEVPGLSRWDLGNWQIVWMFTQQIILILKISSF